MSRKNSSLSRRRPLPTPPRHRFDYLQRRVALRLDRVWHGRDKTGPIDVIDIFSGCGGMSSGFVAVNGLFPAYRLAAAIDIDKEANATYETNLGLRPMEVDVSRLSRDRSAIERLRSTTRSGHPLVLIGCAHCQGFSSHRNSGGERDERNSLFLDFARIASHLEPDAVVIENVPELLTERYWAKVSSARRMLEKRGYFVYVGIHNMAEFGVPQERFRALMLAMRRPFNPPNGFIRASDFRTVRDAIGDLAPVAAGERTDRDSLHYTARHRPQTIRVIRAVPKDGGSRPPNVGPECLRRMAAKQGKEGYEDVYGRLAWDRPAITITHFARNPASGRFCHPEQDRGLSVREAALLQGFPKTYEFVGSLDTCFRQIGNAVPPPFAAALGLHVIRELGGHDATSFKRGIERPVGTSYSRMIASVKARARLTASVLTP